MIESTAQKLLNEGIAIIPLLPNEKHNHDEDILTKDYKVNDLIPNGNLGINLKKSGWYCIDLDTDLAIHFGNLWLPRNTRIHGRINQGKRELTHFFFKSDESIKENNPNKNKHAELFVDHNIVVYGTTLNKQTSLPMKRFFESECEVARFNGSIYNIYKKICFASAIAPHVKSANTGALKLDACLMRYTKWSDSERESFLLDFYSKVLPNDKDVSPSKFRRIVKCNNKEVKNAGYNSYGDYIGVDRKKIKEWLGWIGEVPQDSKYERVKSLVDFTSKCLDMNKLMTQVIPPLQYAVEPIVPEGFICGAGRPKSNKSWTFLNMCFCVQNGSKFMGHETKQGDALYLALEDGKRRIKDRILKMGLNKLKYPTITLEAPYLGFGLEESLSDWIDEVERPKLIVIDTLAKVKPRSSKKSGTAYDHDSEMLRDIQKLAVTKQVSIVAVSHLTKAPQDYTFDRITGSAGMQGIPDTLWMIDKGDNSNSASIIGIGRDIRDFEYSVNWNEEKFCYDYAGNLSDIKKNDNRTEILEAMKVLEASGTKDIRPRNVVRHLGYAHQSRDSRRIAKNMQRMLEEGELGRGGKFGTYTNIEKTKAVF